MAEESKKLSKFVSQFKAARMVSTPLIAVRTPDPAATIESIVSTFTKEQVVIEWDVIDGLKGMNKLGEEAAGKVCDGKPAFSVSARPADALSRSSKLPARSIVFFKNFHNYLQDPVTRQAAWKLRDQFKMDGRTCVLMGPDFTFPSDLSNDVLILDEELPGDEELKQIVITSHEDLDLPTPEEEKLNKAVDALIGLAAFPAEQVCAMSITKEEGLNLESLWERKRKQIEQVPGLSVFRGTETFDNVGGCDNIKKFLTRFISGKEPPRLFAYIDEIDKSLGGTGEGGDTTGVSQSLLGTLLSWMQDKRSNGIIFIGPPGAAKSAIAKAAGNTAQVPTVEFDLNGMKDSLVGQSEQNLRNALKVLDSMGQGRVFFIATCNRIASLPPELRRRFTLGTFFFDLPDAQERETIWTIYSKKYSVENPQINFDDNGWTGAEIEQCCKASYMMNCSLDEASQYIVPVSLAAKDTIEELRTQANGRFISASHPGVYLHNQDTEFPVAGRKKKLRQINDES